MHQKQKRIAVVVVVVGGGGGGGGVSFSIVIIYQSISTRIETQPIPQHKVNTLQINNIDGDVIVSLCIYILVSI